MNIVIAGDGEVGSHLAELLASEDHNITIVDPHEELLRMVESHLDLMTITGDSTSISTLKQANIQKADLLISVLHNEQINIVTAILGKKLGAKRTIARINNPEFLNEENKELFKSLGVDYLVSPESIAAKEIVKLLNYPSVTEVFEFSEGKLSLFLLKLDKKSAVVNKTLNQVALEHPHLKNINIFLCNLQRYNIFRCFNDTLFAAHTQISASFSSRYRKEEMITQPEHFL